MKSDHRYLLVPQTLDSQRLSWNEIGVRPADIPRSLFSSSVDIAKQRQLEIVADSFRVAVQPQVAPRPEPRIRLADTSVTAGPSAGQIIFTRLIVASDGLPDCTLQLPADQQLVSVLIDGRPALITKTVDSRRLRLALGPARFPQSLEIVSRTVGESHDARRVVLQRPNLLIGDTPIPVEVSLWTFAELPSEIRSQIIGPAPVTALDQTALRFDRLVSIAESATAAAADAPAPDGENWSRPWATLLQVVEDQSRHILSHTSPAATLAQVSQSSEDQINHASQRLAKWLQQVGNARAGTGPRQSSTASRSADSSATSPSLDARYTACFVAEGGADQLTLQLNPSAGTRARTRLVAWLLLLGLAATGNWLRRSPTAVDFFCRWPEVLGILLGVVYWAWLWPSWVGLLIVAVSLWLSLRFDWPGASFRAEPSTVLRSTRSQ